MTRLHVLAPLTLPMALWALTNTAALAQSVAGRSASADPAAMGDGGLARYWWIIVIVLLAAAALWYFLRRSNRTA